MIVSHKPKMAFIKPNKIAGTSIVNILATSLEFDNSLRAVDKGDHQTFRQLEQVISIKEYYVFSFVRNPWDRLVSMFRYLKEIEVPKRKKENKPYDVTLETMHFKEYIKSSDVFKPRSFYDFFKNKNNKIDLNFIGKFENLDKDFEKVKKELNLNFKKIPHKNKSKHKHYTEYYNDETKQIVAKKYAKDIEHFGYEFGE